MTPRELLSKKRKKEEKASPVLAREGGGGMFSLEVRYSLSAINVLSYFSQEKSFSLHIPPKKGGGRDRALFSGRGEGEGRECMPRG